MCQRFKSLGAVALAFSLYAGLATPQLLANGTEELGLPDIPIASGTGIVTAGTGMYGSSNGVIQVNVPDGAVVTQALLYWEGFASINSLGDDSITINGASITGQRIGERDYFYRAGGLDYYTLSYRADITGLGLLDVGTNSLMVDHLRFELYNEGIGIVILYDDASAPTELQVMDGNDTAFEGFTLKRKVTEPVIFSFGRSLESRVADLYFVVGGVEEGGTTRIVVLPEGETEADTYPCLLRNSDGDYWDTTHLQYEVPPGVGSIAVQVASGGTCTPPGTAASLVWVAAALSIPQPTTTDCDTNGVPDVCDLSCEGECSTNGLADVCNHGFDCNSNGVPDSCDIRGATSSDCDGNHIPDECDVSSGEVDCNGNEVPDMCDIAAGSSTDCNTNGAPDECDVVASTSTDCNSNSYPDECEIISPIDPWRWVGGDGLWNVATNWCPASVPDNAPGREFDVIVSGADSLVGIDISPQIRTLLSTNGATLEVNAFTGDQSLEVVAGLENSGMIQAREGGVLSLTADVTQGPPGKLLADGAGSKLELTNKSLVRGGTLMAGSNGLVSVNEESTVRDASLLDAGGGMIQLLHESVLMDSTAEILQVPDGHFGHLAGHIRNVGTIGVMSQSAATGLTTDAAGVDLEGTGVLRLFENEAQSQSRATLGTNMAPLVNSNGHTISGTGRIDATKFDNEGAIVAVKNGRRALAVLAAEMTNEGSMRAEQGATLMVLGDFETKMTNEGEIVVEDGASLLFLGDVISQTNNLGNIRVGPQSTVLVFGDLKTSTSSGRVEVHNAVDFELFGDLILEANGQFVATNGAGGDETMLTVDRLYVLDSTTNGVGTRVEVGGNVVVDTLESVVVDGRSGCALSRACTPPVYRIRGNATVASPSAALASYGQITLGESGALNVSGDVSVTDGGLLATEPGAIGTALQANQLLVTNAGDAGGRVELEGGGSATFGSVLLDAGECTTGLRACTPPVYQVGSAPLVQVHGSFSLLSPVGKAASTNGPAGPRVQVNATVPMRLEGDFDNRSQDPSLFDWSASGVRLEGSSARSFEAAGRDHLASTSGLPSEFTIGSIDIASNAVVEFVDAFDNDGAGQAPCTEAVYVWQLRMQAGAQVTVNDCRVYAAGIIDDGANITTTGCGAIVLVPTGDFDANSLVESIDFAAFAECLSESGPDAAPADDQCRIGDFDRDGDVDLMDFWEFEQRFGLPARF